MAKLYFEIEADYKKVIRLREEIEKLQKTMKGFSSHTSANEIKKLEAELKSLREEYGRLTNKAAKSAASIEKAGMSIGKALAAVGGVAALKQLGSEIIRVRGEFQEMETAIETLVGKEMSDRLIPQIKELAKVSPLTMTDIVGAEKMMLGFNIEADKTIGFLKALSDVSMGNSQKFNSLTLAFSQMSAAGKLMGSDLNQMINAGFNPLQQISAKTGKSIATLKEEMSKGAVSAEMVQQAFIDATSAGGKFYKMSENASKTINGQISMLEDAWNNAFNEMGKNSEEYIMKGIEATTTLVQNYETVGRIIVSLVSTYGVYKAALITNIALEKAQAFSRLASIKHTTALGLATDILTKKMTALNVVSKANPYVLLATALIGLVGATWALRDSSSAAEISERLLNEQIDEQNRKHGDYKEKIDGLVSSLGNLDLSEGKRLENLALLKQEYPEILKDINTENDFLERKHEILQLINQEQGKQVALSKKELLDKSESTLNQWKQWRSRRGSNFNVDMGDGSRRFIDDAITAMEANVNKLKTEIAQPSVDNYLAGVKDLTNNEITERITELTGIMQGLENATDDVVVKVTSLGGSFSKGQLRSIKTTLEGEKESRGGAKATAKGWVAKYKKDYEAAQKEVDDFMLKRQELSEDIFERELKKLTDKRDAAKKKYEDAGGSVKSNEKEIEKENAKAKELLAIQRQNEQDRIEIEKKGREKRLALIDLNHQIELDKIEEQRKEWLKASGSLTEEQEEALKQSEDIANKKKEQSTLEVYQDEAAAMRDFLKEYGTYQQQKLAIAEEYAEKIKKAQTEGEKKSLEKEKGKRIQDVEISAIKQQIDWGSTFGSFGKMFNDQIEPTIKKLQDITKSDTFKSSSAEDQKLVYEIIDKLQRSTTVWDGDVFVKVSKDLEAYTKEQKAYNDVMHSQTATAEQVAEAQIKLSEATVNLQSSSSQAVNMFTQLADGLRGLGSGTLEGIGQGLMQLDQLFKTGITKDVGNALVKGVTKLFGKDSEVTKTLTEALGDSGFIGEIISAILSILDILKEGVGTLISSLIDTILGAIDGILSNILSGKFIEQIGGSLISGVGNILDSVTRAIGNVLSFGALDGGISDWFTNSNAKEVAETTERLTSRNEILTQSIDALRDEMEKARGMQSVESYKEAVVKQRELIDNTGDVLAAQMGYHGAHHSNSYYIAKALTDSDWAKISTTVGKKVASTSDLWNLSPEDLKKVSQLTDIWDKIYNGGKYDKSEYIDAYLELAGSLEEMEKELNESLTQVSFDSMYDGFLNTLMDMESTSKDFADDISEYFMKAMLTNKIGELYSEELEKWYNKYADYMKDDGQLDETEMNELKGEYDKIVNKAIAERDAIAAATGYDKSTYSQEATSKGYQTMSQETGDELNGRFTALQVAGEEIKNQTSILTITANEIKAINSGIRDIAAGIQDQMASSYLELVAINENTGLSAKYLKSIESGITDIKDNIKNL